MDTVLTPIYALAREIHKNLDSKGIRNIDDPQRDSVYTIVDKAENAYNKNNYRGVIKQKNKMEKLLKEVQK